MAEGVVDLLEIVQIDEHGGCPPAVAPGATYRLHQAIVGQRPVGQAG
jgi:hypothetical protein